MLIDTHAHLDLPQFDRDRDEVIRRALDNGVGLIINPGIHVESSRAAVRLAEKHESVYAAVGVHAHDAATYTDTTIDELVRLAEHPKVVAIGECGLDFYRDYAPHDLQRSVFREQIRLAKAVKKPLIVHSRGAEAEVLRMLVEERAKSVRGILHCFGGTLEEAKQARALGFHVGFGGTLTYPKADRLALATSFVIDSIVIETDAPYLAPVPHRGRRNEPAFLRYSAEKLAEPGPFTLDDVHRITSHNARRLFRIGDPDMTRIAYNIRNSLYLNITNRCTLSCTFCPKTHGEYSVKGHNLKLEREPTVDEIMESIGNPGRWREIVFCGYGESTLRLDAMKEVARRLKALGVKRIRLDTDGLANFVYGRDVTPELEGLVDAVSVSLNTPDEESYNRICRPGRPGNAYEGAKEFIRRVKRVVPEVTVTAVGLPNLDAEAVRRMAEEELGVRFRCREYNIVG